MSEFYREHGIIYSVHPEAIGNQRHSLPHVHAKYQNYEISVDLQGNIIRGELPTRKEREALKWIKNNLDLCQKEWNKMCGGE